MELVLDGAATRQLETVGPSALVSLPVPNVSLLTNLRLLAAQVDFKVEVVRTGVILSPADFRAESGGDPLSLPLSGKTMEHFKDTLDAVLGRIFRNKDGLEITVRTLSGDKTVDAADGSGGDVLFDTGNPSQDSTGPGNAAGSSAGAVETTVGDDGYTIDLNLELEVIDFEDFINYGSPIQTTGINALGQGEPVVLTDSKILQPVFATRDLPDPRRQALARILGAMGVSDRTGVPSHMVEPFLDPQAANSFEAKRNFNRGLGFLDLGQCNEAEKQFDKALASAPTNPQFIEQVERAQANIGKLIELYQNKPGDHSGPAWTRQVMSFSKDALTFGKASASGPPWEDEEKWAKPAGASPDQTPFPGYSWNDEVGTLAASDQSLRTRRILTEVTAAIQESARLGASLEFTAAADWQDGRPPKPPSAKTASLPPATGNRPGLSGKRAARAASTAGNPRVTLRSGTYSLASAPVAIPDSPNLSFLSPSGKNLSARVEAAGAGFRVRVWLDLPETPNFTALDPAALTTSNQIPAEEFMVSGPDWNRLDYPIPGSGTNKDKLSLFIKLTRTPIPDE